MARVAFARAYIEVATLFAPDSFRERLLDALVAGTEVERYTRVWRVGKVVERDGVLYARIGFERDGRPTDLWDADELDFVEQLIPSGTVSPFAIDLETGLVAFQLRGADIKVGSFVGALEEALRNASDQQWLVEPVVIERSFESWARSVDRVTRVHTQLGLPNPNWKGRELIQQAMEGASAAHLDMTWTSDDGLDIEAAVIAQAVAHAKRYGEVKAQGFRNGRESRFRGTRETPTAIVTADPETGDVGPEGLLLALSAERQSDVGLSGDRP